MKRVKVIQPVTFLHKGKFYRYGAEFDYDGADDERLKVIGMSKSNPEQETVMSPPVQNIQPQPVQQSQSQTMELTEVVVEKTPDGAEIVSHFDGSDVSPEAIKAEIERIEKAKVVVKSTNYFLKKVKRGWYQVVDEKGKVVSSKKMRKDDAENYIKNLK